ncbi:hypothetical protein F4776DRAFT_622250 [Hypoxylon sp. NC0597]|nr:hypothetical protein F4776DRAFT_622250 [Hypoxylon sp. NC0597]
MVDLDFIYFIPEFLYGWTLALLLFALCTIWDDGLDAFIGLVYIYLILAVGCFLFALHPLAFFSVALLICNSIYTRSK